MRNWWHPNALRLWTKWSKEHRVRMYSWWRNSAQFRPMLIFLTSASKEKSAVYDLRLCLCVFFTLTSYGFGKKEEEIHFMMRLHLNSPERDTIWNCLWYMACSKYMFGTHSVFLVSIHIWLMSWCKSDVGSVPNDVTFWNCLTPSNKVTVIFLVRK